MTNLLVNNVISIHESSTIYYTANEFICMQKRNNFYIWSAYLNINTTETNINCVWFLVALKERTEWYDSTIITLPITVTLLLYKMFEWVIFLFENIESHWVIEVGSDRHFYVKSFTQFKLFCPFRDILFADSFLKFSRDNQKSEMELYSILTYANFERLWHLQHVKEIDQSKYIIILISDCNFF